MFVGPGIDAVRIRSQRGAEVGCLERRRSIRETGESIYTPPLVCLQQFLAEDFRELSPHRPAEQLHLEEPVSGRDVALSEEEIVLVRGLDVRDAA